MNETVSVTQIGETLLVNLQGDLDDTTVLQIENQLAAQVARVHAKGLLIDVSGLTMVDSFIARVLARIVGMIRLLGAQAAIVGMQPAVAITLVELGLPMGHLDTALGVEQGMFLLHRLRSHGYAAE